MFNRLSQLGLVAMALAATACASQPVVGEWENEESGSSLDDVLHIEEDGIGTRALEQTWLSEGVSFKISIEWTISWEEKGEGEYDAELECENARAKADGETIVSGCQEMMEALGANLDFDVECKLNAAEDELDCELEDGSEVTFERVGE